MRAPINRWTVITAWGCQQWPLHPFVNEDFCSFSPVISGNKHVWISVTFAFRKIKLPKLVKLKTFSAVLLTENIS